MNNIDCFRPRSSVFAALTLYFVILVLAIQSFSSGSWNERLTSAIWSSFAATLVYVILHRPMIELFDEGIRITNPFNQITVGWQRVESIDAKYTMSIQVGEKTIYAWAAPAPGRYHGRTVHASEIKGMDIGAAGFIRPGDSPRTHSGTAAYLAILRLKAFRDSESTNGCESRVDINRFAISILITTSLAGLALNIFHF